MRFPGFAAVPLFILGMTHFMQPAAAILPPQTSADVEPSFRSCLPLISLRLWEGHKPLWKIPIAGLTETASKPNKIAVFPDQRFLVYTDLDQTGYEPGVYARGFDGSVRWKRSIDDAPDWIYSYFLLAGGNIVLLRGHGPYGHWRKEGYQDAKFINDSLSGYWVRAFRADTGKFLWMHTYRNMGEPIWTDGDFLLTIREVPQPSQDHDRPTPCIYWLEKRRASNCHLVWQKRIPVHPIDEDVEIADNEENLIIHISETHNRLRVRIPIWIWPGAAKRTRTKRTISMYVPISSARRNKSGVAISRTEKKDTVDVRLAGK